MRNQSINYIKRLLVGKKKSKDQFGNYKKWTTDEGYTFMAQTKEDALEYLKHMEHANLGKLREVTK